MRVPDAHGIAAVPDTKTSRHARRGLTRIPAPRSARAGSTALTGQAPWYGPDPARRPVQRFLLAVVVLGGLLTAVVLNMLVVPALFLRYGVERPHDRKPARNQRVELTF